MDSGIDAAVVGEWIADVQGQRLAAEREVDRHTKAAPLDTEQIRALVTQVSDPIKMLADAAPDSRAEIYRELALRLLYTPKEKAVKVEVPPLKACTEDRVGEET